MPADAGERAAATEATTPARADTPAVPAPGATAPLSDPQASPVTDDAAGKR